MGRKIGLTPPTIVVQGDEYLGFSHYNPDKNVILWALKYDDPLLHKNLDTLAHEYLHWILENFVSVHASIRFDRVDRWPDFYVSCDEWKVK